MIQEQQEDALGTRRKYSWQRHHYGSLELFQPFGESPPFILFGESNTDQQQGPTPCPLIYSYSVKSKWWRVMQHDNRPLTHDEKKAAEAAFHGSPFDPQWSEAARKVYVGLSVAKDTLARFAR
jgi:hypothetical protein